MSNLQRTWLRISSVSCWNKITYNFLIDNATKRCYTVCMTTHILTKDERAEQKSRTFLKVLNSLALETVLDWMYRAGWALQDSKLTPPLGERLSLRRYLEETKEVALATIRMSKIEDDVHNLSYEEKQRREQILDQQRQPFLEDLEGMIQ